MPYFEENIEQYRKQKQKLIVTDQKKVIEKKPAEKILKAPVEKEKKAEGSKSAYRKILAADFDNATWISKGSSLRKHRKNINKNYKALTGRKLGLSGEEKLKRKNEFEARRELSLKASMALKDFIGSNNDADPDPSDAGVLRALEDLDLKAFAYGDGSGAKQDVASDAAFISGFSGKMALLHNASLLYNKVLQGNPDGVSPEILRKLSQMNDMRQAYEDRIRIISSPYYVSLRDADFDKSTKKKLREGDGDEKRSEDLKAYAQSVLRWQESGRKLLSVKKAPEAPASAEEVTRDKSILAENKEYVSDQAIEKVIGKINAKRKNQFKNNINSKTDQAMEYTRKWVESDLKDKPNEKKLKLEVQRMKDRLSKDLTDTGLKESVRKNYEKVLRHLNRVSLAYEEKKVSSDVMRIWLDRCLQHKLNYEREMYLTLVHQGLTRDDEEDYYDQIAKSIDPYVNEMSGVIFAQNKYSGFGIHQRKQDCVETDDPAILRARRGFKLKDKSERNKPDYERRVKEYKGLWDIRQSDGNDFLHISGKNADFNDTSTRAYISAKPKYKSLVVRLFTETLGEFKDKNMRDEIYFKITNGKDKWRGYATDDLTIYFGSNVSLEERKTILDRFYEKCSQASKEENVLDGENMVISGAKYKDGIAMAGEPEIASLLNKHFSNADKNFKATYSNRTKLKEIKNLSTNKVSEEYSFNSFIISMLIQSSFIAGHRLSKKGKAIDTDDPKVKEETKKIFRELCFLNGINPENMADIDNKTIFG